MGSLTPARHPLTFPVQRAGKNPAELAALHGFIVKPPTALALSPGGGHPMSGWFATVTFSLACVAAAPPAPAEPPTPVLNTLFPAGGRAGTTVRVSVDGSGLDELTALRFADPRVTSQRGEVKQVTLTLPADLPPGV